MNTEEVRTLIEFEEPILLLNVLPPELRKVKRWTGTANACAYEMSGVGEGPGALYRLTMLRDSPLWHGL